MAVSRVMEYDCLNAVSYYFYSVHCLVAMYAMTEAKTLILCQNHKQICWKKIIHDGQRVFY